VTLQDLGNLGDFIGCLYPLFIRSLRWSRTRLAPPPFNPRLRRLRAHLARQRRKRRASLAISRSRSDFSNAHDADWSDHLIFEVHFADPPRSDRLDLLGSELMSSGLMKRRG
jgi:hypothetical protein